MADGYARFVDPDDRRIVGDCYPAAEALAEQCRDVRGPFVCTREKHEDNPHVAHLPCGDAVAVWLQQF